jgi:hypothetical protein
MVGTGYYLESLSSEYAIFLPHTTKMFTNFKVLIYFDINMSDSMQVICTH